MPEYFSQIIFPPKPIIVVEEAAVQGPAGMDETKVRAMFEQSFVEKEMVGSPWLNVSSVEKRIDPLKIY